MRSSRERETGAVPSRSISRCSASVESGERSARCTTGARRAPTSVARPTGKVRWPVRADNAGMRPLAVLGDNITTDHLSPSNAIWRAVPLANTWRKDGTAGRGLQLLRHAPR